MPAKDLVFDESARRQLRVGIDALANAVKIAIIPLFVPVIFIFLELLFGTIQALVTWTEAHQAEIALARAEFDAARENERRLPGVLLPELIEVTADPVLEELLNELCSYPAPGDGVENAGAGEYAGVAVPFRFVTGQGVLSFISATTIFGTPVDVTLSELALESFFPADAATAMALRGL